MKTANRPGRPDPKAGPAAGTKGLSSKAAAVVLGALVCLGAASPLLPGGAALGDAVTIRDAVSIVISEGYGVRIALSREAAAGRSEDRARAGYLPRVNAYADHTWLRDQPEAVFAGGTSPLGEDSFLRYGITVDQLITDFGRTAAAVRGARAGVRETSLETDRTRNAAVLDLVSSYVFLLRAGKALSLADLEVERFRSHLADARSLYEAGEVTLHDVLGVEVALAEADLRRITARDDRDLALSALNFLILRPLQMPAEVREFGPLLSDAPDLERAVSKAADQRWELRILDERISAAQARVSAERSGRYPTLFARGGYAFEENSYRVHEDNWSATLGLTWDLYTGGARSSAIGGAMDELNALFIRRDEVEGSILLQVRDAHRLFTGAVERTLVTSKAVSQAEENLRLLRSMYAEGEATATEVTDAVTSLARAEVNHWEAAYGRLQAEARLLYATGEDMAGVYGSDGVPDTEGSTGTATGEEP